VVFFGLFVVLFGEYGVDEVDDCLVVGEDFDYVGVVLDFVG